jgi:hypothetical protein
MGSPLTLRLYEHEYTGHTGNSSQKQSMAFVKIYLDSTMVLKLDEAEKR